MRSDPAQNFSEIHRRKQDVLDDKMIDQKLDYQRRRGRLLLRQTKMMIGSSIALTS